MIRLVLIRPGATLYDEQGRIQGSLDVPLSERGRAEADQVVKDLADAHLDILYTAPCASALETARRVGEALRVRVRPVDELRNLNHGLWQGLELEEVKRRHLKLFRQWQEDPRCVCPPCGEPMDAADDRMRVALRSIARRHRGGAVGLVVPDPMALLVASYLKSDCPVRLDDRGMPGAVEWIEVGTAARAEVLTT